MTAEDRKRELELLEKHSKKRKKHWKRHFPKRVVNAM